MKPTRFDELYREAESHDDYWIAGTIQELTEEISRRMEEEKISRGDLARRLGTSPAYVTKILRGNANFTLATMVKLARALGTELRIRLAPPEKVIPAQPRARPRRGSGGVADHHREKVAARPAAP
ncbi:MAG: helix-turn-helix transcriptional regulator [bacterium]|nr:helix-turn-helix transcriptional regulator [bacterium]